MKTNLALLDCPFIFSQQGPLFSNEFIKEAKRRGVALEIAHLDALHRAGILVPIYRVSRDVEAVRAELKRGLGHLLPEETDAARVITLGPCLQQDRDSGRLVDPRGERARPWRSYRRSFGRLTYATEEWVAEHQLTLDASVFLYSPYQFLLLPLIRGVLPLLRGRRDRGGTLSLVRRVLPLLRGLCSQGGTLDSYTVPSAVINTIPRAVVERNDELVVGLSALDSAYRWRVTGQATTRGWGGIKDWEAYIRAFNPTEALAWLGWQPDRVAALAYRLLREADTVDPLADEWRELVRLANPQMWERLQGDALIAMDHRIAAEMLLQFYEDLERAGAAPALNDVSEDRLHPWHGRLRVDRNRLDRTLTTFGLSPYPELIVVLEGHTEYEVMMPRVMDILSIPRSRTGIWLENAETVDRDLIMLVSYAVTPQLGEQLGDSVVTLDRSPTRFLVVVDPESKYETQEQRDHRRDDWRDKILAALPEHLRQHPRVVDQVANLVQIETWSEEGFEYAHFSDEELALAIQHVGTIAGAEGKLAWVTPAKVASQRAKKANLEKIVEKQIENNPEGQAEKSTTHLSKVALAKELWPVLEARIKSARADGTLDSIPIARVALKDRELARISARQRAFDVRVDTASQMGRE